MARREKSECEVWRADSHSPAGGCQRMAMTTVWKDTEAEVRRTIVHGQVAVLAAERLEPLAEQRKVLRFILCHL